MRISFIFTLLVSTWIEKTVSQNIYICDSPEKDSHCVLKCKTKDFLQPVTFSHPPNNDVGSCILPHQCRSNYDRYSLWQTKIGTENVTYFNINQLSREKDEGKWICSYGNRASTAEYITVLTRPVNVDVFVNDTGKFAIVNCSCYCVYRQDSIRLEIEISKKDRRFKRRLDPLYSVDVPQYNCLAEEKTIIGTNIVQKDNWPGNFIDISCTCTEEKLKYLQEKTTKHFFHGVPKGPKNLKAIEILSHSVVLTWTKSADGGSRQTFVIQYKDVLRNLTYNTSIEEYENDAVYNISLKDLKSNTKYEVFSYAYNRNGKSTKIGPVSFTTLKEETKKNSSLAIILACTLSAIAIIVVIVALVIWKKISKKQETKQDNQETKSLMEMRETNSNTKSLSDSSRMNIENTKALIDRIVEPGFIQTKSYTQGLRILQISGILVYKGVYGDGRFTNAVQMLKHFEEKGYHPALIHDITKWNEIVNVNVKMILLVPDILSKLAIDKKLYERVYPYYEKMMGCVQKGNTKVIMTCQSQIMNDLWFVLRDYDIFNRDYHIDQADDRYKLTKEEKENILKAHCGKNDITICTKEKEENYENATIINGNMPIKISLKTINEIAETGNDIAYPQYCALFCKHREYTALGKDFFIRPTKCVVESIDKLRNCEDSEKKLQYKILKRLWFSFPDPLNLDEEQNNLGEEQINLDEEEYRKAVEGLNGIYIEKRRENQYALKHQTIYIAVGLSIIKVEPVRVIKESNWNFFRYHIKPITSKTVGDDRDDGTTYYIAEDLYDEITERCLVDLKPDTMYRYFRYFIECWPENAKRILNAIQTKEKYKDKKEEYWQIIQRCCKVDDESGIFVQACIYGNISAIKELRARFDIPQNVLNHCKALSQNKLDVLSALDNPSRNDE